MKDDIRIEIAAAGRQLVVYEKSAISLSEILEKYVYGKMVDQTPADQDCEKASGDILKAAYIPVFARVDDKGRDLSYVLKKSCRVEFLDLNMRMARLVYQRSLYFLFVTALAHVRPDAVAHLRYPLNDGMFIEITYSDFDPQSYIAEVDAFMKKLIEEDAAFDRRVIYRSDALSRERDNTLTEDQVEFIRSSEITEVFEYTCQGVSRIFYDPLVRSAASLGLYELIAYRGDVILRVPQMATPYTIPEMRDDHKLYEAFSQTTAWRNYVDVRSIADLNRKVMNGEWRDLILISEAYQEKNIAAIADEIVKNNKRIILIAGPSSSGKTTFAQRLCIQLRVNGKRPLYMGTDDYFVEKGEVPVDENGKLDFESIAAVDVKLFNDQMNALLDGETVDMPVFDFITGSKRYGTRITRADQDQPIVIEGIHALNRSLTEFIDDEEKFRIYISPLTALNIDDNNRIPVTDVRLLRRMARDMRSRGKTPVDTINEWPDVRAGEIRNIFPYNGEADALFNSALMYEFAVIKPIVEPGLRAVSPQSPAYLEAQRLLRILNCVKPLTQIDAISNNSIMREFTGGGIWVK